MFLCKPVLYKITGKCSKYRKWLTVSVYFDISWLTAHPVEHPIFLTVRKRCNFTTGAVQHLDNLQSSHAKALKKAKLPMSIHFIISSLNDSWSIFFILHTGHIWHQFSRYNPPCWHWWKELLILGQYDSNGLDNWEPVLIWNRFVTPISTVTQMLLERSRAANSSWKEHAVSSVKLFRWYFQESCKLD